MHVCVYGASSDHLDAIFFSEAEELGRLLAQAGHSVVFGGGKTGLMGACARGVRQGGGSLIGIAPRFFDEPGVLDQECSEFLFTNTMRERKQLMDEKSDAFLLLPGGIGSYEEFFEILTLRQLGRHKKPIAILNTASYYTPLNALLHHTANMGFMGASCLELFCLCNTPRQALDYLSAPLPVHNSASLHSYHR